MFNLTSHAFATLTYELLSWKLEEKFHINTCPCIILYIFYPINVALCYVCKRMKGRGRGGGGEGGGEGKKFGKFLDDKYWKQYVSSNEKYPLIVASITTLYLNLGYPT